MEILTQMLTKNDCYKAARFIKPRGLMLHSTGANNPKLSRYIGPDDGILGRNPNNNDWNQPGIRKCVHGFIGLDKNGKVRTYRTLPWEMMAWHSGGKANNTHISIEICEGNLNDAKYFKEVYAEAVELFAHLCKRYGLNPMKDIIDHSEGRKKRIASNHGDVMHWFPIHGKSMDTFRRDVQIRLLGKPVVTNPSKPSTKPKPVVGKSILELAQEVIDGKHGSGPAREKSLGSSYKAVQSKVNELLQSANRPRVKSISELADEVISGKHGTGRERMVSLGSKYEAVQKEVNRKLRG